MTNNLTIKDGNSVSQVMQTTDNAGVHSPAHYLVTSGGASVEVEPTSNCLCTIDIQHAQVHKGNHFFVKSFAEITGASTTAEFLIKTGAKFPHARVIATSNAEFIIDIYEGTTVSADGTPVTVFNNDRNSATTATVSLFTSPTITGDGTLLWRSKLGDSGNPAGSLQTSQELIAKDNENYLLRITKVTSGTHYIDYDFFWYEVS